MQIIKSLESSVEGLIDCEKLYWKHRSRVDWLEARDRNSKFFHARATARKKKNQITGPVDRLSNVQNSEEGLAQVMSRGQAQQCPEF
ncbi:hypothetical protein EZV62_024248 [Acer yangbiense]|uniref:Uncharacterized protein n=1 Tax=Acer yangbiense TaxID=1000413 RepID=A0A5C7H3Z8_9ROSI|nr:hypothetical protein EZV62_024248 [Acer yangbiense]